MVELVEGGTGGAILGPAGVGKSRLLHEASDRVRASRIEVVPVVGSVSTRAIPFAPFVELLPSGPTRDELAMLGAARQTLEARAGPRGVFLAVDDAHHLDPTSLSFLISAVSSGIATVGLTARSGEPMAPDLVDLWTNGVIRRFDLGPLSEADTRNLIESSLGTASHDLHAELWRLSQGNPLVLHEILEGAVDSGIAQNESGIWEQTGSLTDSPRLSDLVMSRLSALPDRLRASMEVIAVGSPLPEEVAFRALGDDMALLEQRRLVDVAVAASAVVTPAHPLHGEILEAQIGTSRSRAARRRLVRAALDVGDQVDPLRLAVWQQESGEHVDDDVALTGANEAILRHDPDLAAELLDPLDAEDDRVALLLGKSLSYRNQFHEAEKVLSGRHPTDPELLAEIVSIRGHNLAFGLGRIDEARDSYATAATEIDDPDLRARLNNERAMISGISGDFADVEEASNQVLDDPNTSDMSRAAAYVGLTVAYGMTGDSDGMDACIDDARDVAERASRVLPFASDQVEIMMVMSLINGGRLREALQLAGQLVEDGQRPPAMVSTLLGAQTLTLIERGRLRQALESAALTMQAYQDSDPFGLQSQTLGLSALARGQSGDADADEALSGLDREQLVPRLGIWVARGRGWSAAARGDVDVACEIVRDGGMAGLAGHHTAWGAMCLHDAVRFGRVETVADDLLDVDTSRGASYIAAMQLHAKALRERDADLLAAVASNFDVMGADLVAAEAFARLSVLRTDGGDEVGAARACARSKILESRCEEPATPALAERPDLVTDREIEVVGDATAGLTSPQIAERRFISVRTVDNHLRSVYRKLAVSGREELSRLF